MFEVVDKLTGTFSGPALALKPVGDWASGLIVMRVTETQMAASVIGEKFHLVRGESGFELVK